MSSSARPQARGSRNAGDQTTGTGQPERLRRAVEARADKLGFVSVGFAPAGELGIAHERLMAFLAAGRHGEMVWLETESGRRASPKTLMAGARSVVMLGTSYAPQSDPLDALSRRERGVFAAYARGRDYHDVIKGRLKEIAGLIAREAGADVKVFVDTAPLMEKPLAERAGLGWQGKHTNLVSRGAGSWLLLGAILTSATFAYDEAETDHCGTCTRCLDICPTKAFPAPYQLDARRCLAYLSIEYGGHIAEEFREPMGNRVFGCDDCLAVCPWNKFAGVSKEAKFAAREWTDSPAIAKLLELDEPTFRKAFAGTPVKRTGYRRVMRNTLIAAGNSGDAELLPLVVARLTDASAIVRAMAVWAVGRLAGPEMQDSLAERLKQHETDGDVLAEWERLAGPGASSREA